MAHLPLYLLIAAVLFVGIVVAYVDPILVAMLALPGALAVQRVGGASLNISICDVLTVAGTAAALPLLRADMRVTRRLLSVDLIFQAVLLLVVLVHPNEKSVFEWWHRLFIVSGCIVIGAVLGRTRRASTPVTALLGLVSGLSVAAVGWTFAHGLQPASLLGFQKNAVGAMTASAVLIAVLRPNWLRLTRSQLLWIAAVSSAGLLASQSRGAMLALAAALFFVAARQGRLPRRGLVAVLVLVPLVVVALVSLHNQIAQHRQFSSLTVRAGYNALAYKEWHLAPVFGQGLRYFKQPGALLQVDAPSVLSSTLAEGGLVGLFALALLIGGAVKVLWRLPVEVGTLALAFLFERLVHGLFDIYWVAGTASLAWLIIGIVCGTADADASEADPAPPSARDAVVHGGRHLGDLRPRR